jgi:hypothetical protein
MTLQIPLFLTVTLIGMIVAIVAAGVAAGLRLAILRSNAITNLVVGLTMGMMITSWRAVVALIAVGVVAYLQLTGGASSDHACWASAITGAVSGVILSFTMR